MLKKDGPNMSRTVKPLSHTLFSWFHQALSADLSNARCVFPTCFCDVFYLFTSTTTKAPEPVEKSRKAPFAFRNAVVMQFKPGEILVAQKGFGSGGRDQGTSDD